MVLTIGKEDGPPAPSSGPPLPQPDPKLVTPKGIRLRLNPVEPVSLVLLVFSLVSLSELSSTTGEDTPRSPDTLHPTL